MKYAIIFIVMIPFAVSDIRAQMNLVPNPSFEDTLFCPLGLTQINACSDWLNFGNTPDYFNGCAQNGVNVPNCGFGFQNAHSGNAFAGLIPWRIPTSPDGPNYREFVGAQLINPLQIGVKYYFSFYVNFSYTQNVAIACNKLGLLFSTIQYNQFNPAPIYNFAHLFSDSILKDSVSWIRISGSFIADSSYNFIILGNFFDDQHTDTMAVSSFPDSPYYYYDDICVTEDSLYNENWTKINYLESFKNVVKLFPNPSDGKIRLISEIKIKEIKIFDAQGRLVEIFYPNLIDVQIELNHLTPGIYSLVIQINNSVEVNLISLINKN